MKVLMISGDRNILKERSNARMRFELQKSHVEQLDVFVWPQRHSWRDITEAAQENHYDVITAQDPFWRGLLAWMLARRTRAKLNIQVHTDLQAQPFIRHILAQIVLRHADSVRVVSRKIQQQVEKIGVSTPIHVLPIFVDLERFRTLVRRPHERKTILWLGRFEAEKSPQTAIAVFRQVRGGGTDAELIMLGAGSLEQELQQQAQGLPVTFPGWQDPTTYLEVADVVLSTSTDEGYGASIVEALAAGIPVVAPDVGIAREAGAVVVEREKFGAAIVRVFHSGERGVLKLSLPNAEEWAKQWLETLT